MGYRKSAWEIINKVAKEGLTENVTCEQKPKRMGRPACRFPGRELPGGRCLVCGKEATAAGNVLGESGEDQKAWLGSIMKVWE